MLYVGTSGWQYDHWKGRFYPEDVPASRWLDYYARQFATVEVNNSFYRLPERRTFQSWRRETPDDFVVAVKANRYLTHMKKLKDAGPIVANLMQAAEGLGARLGPVLLQLPPNFRAAPGRLREALDAFPQSVRLAVELRHESWFTEDVRRILEQREAALCLADRGGRVVSRSWRTAQWGYLRLHEGDGSPHPGYRPSTLARWADRLADRFQAADDLFVYFNNDASGCAVRDAATFADLCRERGLEPARTGSLKADPAESR